ncbi:helix-turn-helix transcriptional regulator [Pedobacter sp. ASV28]|uniref:response regulator transcription factor n=1 Tax=Pedobacter sp. ASV28 TaxID=2795123 RepID=UPI0018EB7806
MEETIRPLPYFTTRERRILRLIADGLNNTEISEEIFIGIESVKIHRQDILKKSGCKSMLQLIQQCTLQGVI